MKKTAIFIASISIFFSGIFVSPAPLAYAQVAPPDSVNINTNIEKALDKGCSNEFNPFSSTCLLYAFYSIILEPSFWILGLGANLLDFFLGYSLDSNAYTSDFIQKGWSLIRDISNIAFIFTLLYLAIRHILGMSAKKAIPTLIVVALLLNFSLFFTKVVIDAGNILARAFYKSIVIENDRNYEGVDGYKSITFGLVDKINPQNLLSEGLFRSTSVDCEYSTETSSCVGEATLNLDDKTGTVFAILILMVIINLVLTWTFVSVALLFVGRVIGLWFSMIFSPIAFITLAVPGSGGFLKQLSFDTWKDTVLKLAFVAPVFIFFLYLTISFLDIIFKTGATVAEVGDPFMKIMNIFIPFIFIIFLLQLAKKTAESMAGEFGSMVKSVVGKVAGVAGGVALGATAFVGRKVVGGLASSALKGGGYNKRIADAREKLKDGNLSGYQKMRLKADLASLRATKSTLSSAKKSSFDIRNADKSKMLWGGVGAAAGFAGKNIVRPGMNSFAGKDFTVGKGSKESRDKFEKDQEKKTLAMAEDQSSVSFREKQMFFQDKELATKEIEAIKESREELSGNFDEQTRVIQERLDELIQKPNLTQQEKDEMDTLEKRVDDEIPKEKEKALEYFDLSKKDELAKAKVKANFDVKVEEKRRKNLVADSVESRDMWGSMMGVDNKEFADSIRSGKKSKSPEEIIREQMKKIDKEEDKPKDEDKKEPDKPKDDESK